MPGIPVHDGRNRRSPSAGIRVHVESERAFTIVRNPHFHPLAGQRVSILFERRYKSAVGLVYICEGGALGTVTLPEHFTDRGLQEPATRPLTVDVLADLAAVMSALRKPLTGPEGRVNNLVL